ncbi:DUF424 domain-containing protein [Candidatus Bathyarchaeota archaeon CG07_land_8_20_14_0_80_47_9]|jgi:hypothetical protein|nr:MAG: DUF424 domain-containing protein [Candidatus Bathyarchaeota archaeon CG07_land_8_20_14_0_80_47_9]
MRSQILNQAVVRASSKLEVYMNLKKVGRNVLLAICDAEILGRTLCEGKIVFHVKEDFYKGARVNVEEAISMIENSTIVNMVGKNVVKKAIQRGYVHPEAVLNIEGVPHAQIMKI